MMLRVSALAACLALMVFAAGASANTGTFTDPAGDSGAAPDITSVAVSDNGSGVATLAVTASALTPGDSVYVWIDTDRNASTGDHGADYVLTEYLNVDGSRGWDAGRWDGSTWKSTPGSATETFNRSGNVLTWTFAQTDIGGSTGFNFSVGSYHDDANGNTLAQDDAPDGGSWSFVYTKRNVDDQAPRVHAYAARGHVGKTTRLRFDVSDNSGKARIALAVYKGSRVVASKAFSLQAVGKLWIAWRGSTRGSYRFCVAARDAAGNTSNTSCAPLTMS